MHREVVCVRLKPIFFYICEFDLSDKLITICFFLILCNDFNQKSMLFIPGFCFIVFIK